MKYPYGDGSMIKIMRKLLERVVKKMLFFLMKKDIMNIKELVTKSVFLQKIGGKKIKINGKKLGKNGQVFTIEKKT